MLTNYRDAAQYLAASLRARLRAARGDDSQSGGMTLEWIIIAVALALIAGVAVAVFTAKVNNATSNLP